MLRYEVVNDYQTPNTVLQFFMNKEFVGSVTIHYEWNNTFGRVLFSPIQGRKADSYTIKAGKAVTLLDFSTSALRQEAERKYGVFFDEVDHTLVDLVTMYLANRYVSTFVTLKERYFKVALV